MFSQTVEYSLRAMNYLASHPDNPISSETIAANTQVPPGYLSKVLRDLVVAELIRSQRGPNGGFVLAQPPSKISILDIVDAVDPICRIEKCPLNNPQHINLCPLHARLDEAIAQIRKTLSATTLEELLDDKSVGSGQKTCGSLASKKLQVKTK